MKKAFICGISGQDGSLLAKYLLKKNYKIFGSTRRNLEDNFDNLVKLEIKEKIHLISMNPYHFNSVFNTIQKIMPNEI